jgi:hypothetical protein
VLTDQNDQNDQICEQKWNFYCVKVSGDKKFLLAKVKDIFSQGERYFWLG